MTRENRKQTKKESWKHDLSVCVIHSHNHYLFTQLSPQVTTHWRREQEGGKARTLWVIIVPILNCSYFNPLISFKSLIETQLSAEDTGYSFLIHLQINPTPHLLSGSSRCMLMCGGTKHHFFSIFVWPTMAIYS